MKIKKTPLDFKSNEVWGSIFELASATEGHGLPNLAETIKARNTHSPVQIAAPFLADGRPLRAANPAGFQLLLKQLLLIEHFHDFVHLTPPQKKEKRRKKNQFNVLLHSIAK